MFCSVMLLPWEENNEPGLGVVAVRSHVLQCSVFSDTAAAAAPPAAVAAACARPTSSSTYMSKMTLRYRRRVAGRWNSSVR